MFFSHFYHPFHGASAGRRFVRRFFCLSGCPAGALGRLCRSMMRYVSRRGFLWRCGRAQKRLERALPEHEVCSGGTEFFHGTAALSGDALGALTDVVMPKRAVRFRCNLIFRSRSSIAKPVWFVNPNKGARSDMPLRYRTAWSEQRREWYADSFGHRRCPDKPLSHRALCRMNRE